MRPHRLPIRSVPSAPGLAALGVAALGVAALALVACCAPGGASPTSNKAVVTAPVRFSVGGQEVSDALVRRELVYALGNAQLESKKLDVYIDAEIRRQVEAGVDAAKFAVPEADVQKAAGEAVDQIKEQYKDQNIGVEEVFKSNRLTQTTFTQQVAQAKRFDLVFLPENPKDWPETTRAILESSGDTGKQLLERLEEAFQTRQASAQPADPGGMNMWNMIMRRLVIQGLQRHAKVETAVDGLPAEVCMRINGVDVATDDMFAKVSDLVTSEDRRRARLWIAKVMAVEQELARAGALLEGEAFRAAYEEHEKPYKDSPFPLELLAMGFKKFPSMDSYKRYFRLIESYQRHIESELTDVKLAEHMERANLMLGLATVDCQVLLCSAFDFKLNRWKDGGWDTASARATEVARKLAGGGNWDALLEEYCDYWDPPTPPTAQQLTAPPQLRNKGRFGALNRNELVQRIGESEYEMFLLGSSVADHIFFDQQVGKVEGPFRGTHGYYITKLAARTPPSRPTLSLADKNQRDLILQDYVSCRFNEHAALVLARTAVTGL